MKRTLLYAGFLGFVVMAASCRKGFEEMNKPWNRSSTASVEQLYNGVVQSMVLGWQEQATYHSWIYPVTQQVALPSRSGYIIENAASELWDNYYFTLANVRLMENKINERTDKDKLKNVQAMVKTLMAYKTLKLTEFFGDMPYTDAGRAPVEGFEKYRVKYDKQSEIYISAIEDLKWAVDNFSTGPDQIAIGSYETFFKGDITKWVRFANSLRLRYAVRVYDKNQGVATAHITEALSKPLLADGEDVGLWPAQLTGLVLEGRAWSFYGGCFLRMGSAMWSLMSENNNEDGSGIFDPRCRIFYEPNNAGKWAAYPQNPVNTTPVEGGDPYNRKRNDNWADKGAGCIYAPVNYFFGKDQKYIPELIQTAAEIHFLKAEIYTRGMGVAKNPATARTAYESGIKASVNFWTNIAIQSPEWNVNKPAGLPDATTMNTLLTNPKVAFDLGNETRALQQIYAQLWIDGFRQPWETWALKRRTGNKTPMETANAAYYNSNYGDIHRFTYPASEQNYNGENWRAATGGSDLRSTKIWLEP